jgi:sporulation protein YlmC with PRC-barrel domain
MKIEGKTFETDNRTEIDHDGRNINLFALKLSARSIIGDDVENKQRMKLGSIEDIMINIHSGRIEYIVVAAGGFLGLGQKLFAIPFKELTLEPQTGVFILDRPREYFRRLPGFDKSHWPNTNAHTFHDDAGASSSIPLVYY